MELARMPWRRRRAGMGVVALGLMAAGCSWPASAMLGDDVASVEADRVRIGAGQVQTIVGPVYAVHEMQAPSGTVVREYVSGTGTVFAVAWSGPALPDLRGLLGRYFDTYTEAARSQQAGAGRIHVQLPGLVVQSGGQMRAFFGRAYLPALLPEGMTLDEIR